MAKLNTTLSLNSGVYGGKAQKYASNHEASSVFDTTFKINNSDSLRELIEFKPDGTKTYNKFNYLLIANDGEQTAEIQILFREFGTDDDLFEGGDPYSGTLDFLLHPGKYIILPTAKMFLYSADHADSDPYGAADLSAGNKDGTSAYDTAYSTDGPTFISPPGYFIASETNGDPVELTNSGNYFEADISEDCFKSVQMGDSTTGYSNGKICLFGECHASDPGIVQTVSAMDDDSGTYANTRLTLNAVTGDIGSGTGTYLGAYRPVALLNGAITSTGTTMSYDNFGSVPSADNQMFKKYDVIRVGNELMQVIDTPDRENLTLNRGVLSTTAASHANNDGIGFHYMQDALLYLDGSTATTAGAAPMKGNSNIYTNSKGVFYASTFFGLGRSFSYPNGIVPGSVAIKFFSTASYPLGLQQVANSFSTGLAVNTAYRFKLTVDGTAYGSIAFTTDTVDVTFGNTYSGSGVFRKIQDALNTATCPVSVRIINGDVVFVGKTRYETSSIVIADATGGSGTQLFGQGVFPALTALRASTKPTLPADEDKESIMFDNGTGMLSRGKGGSGYINYETGAFLLFSCPANSHMRVACNTNSALSGNIKTGRNNYIPVIKARSTNAFRDAYVRVTAYDDVIDDSNVEFLATGSESSSQNFIQNQNPGGYSSSGEGSYGGGGGGVG